MLIYKAELLSILVKYFLKRRARDRAGTGVSQVFDFYVQEQVSPFFCYLSLHKAVFKMANVYEWMDEVPQDPFQLWTPLTCNHFWPDLSYTLSYLLSLCQLQMSVLSSSSHIARSAMLLSPKTACFSWCWLVKIGQDSMGENIVTKASLLLFLMHLLISCINDTAC